MVNFRSLNTIIDKKLELSFIKFIVTSLIKTDILPKIYDEKCNMLLNTDTWPHYHTELEQKIVYEHR